MKTQIDTFDRVTFTHLGVLVSGAVSSVKRYREKRRLEIVQDDEDVIWRVWEKRCKKTGHFDDVTALLNRAKRLKNRFIDRRNQLRVFLQNVARDRGLLELKRGDLIDVECKTGAWMRCRFMKFTNRGFVAFYRDGHLQWDDSGWVQTPIVRSADPNYVRVAKQNPAMEKVKA